MHVVVSQAHSEDDGLLCHVEKGAVAVVKSVNLILTRHCPQRQWITIQLRGRT